MNKKLSDIDRQELIKGAISKFLSMGYAIKFIGVFIAEIIDALEEI